MDTLLLICLNDEQRSSKKITSLWKISCFDNIVYDISLHSNTFISDQIFKELLEASIIAYQQM